MTDPKNTFDFGTGSIDKDQWLRDIDAGQDEFIHMYSNSFNKHRTALLRQAFADLRDRISRGDMLNRSADGNYNFGSALNREDKHMADAYAHALGFMSQKARGLLQTPEEKPKEEGKKYNTEVLNKNWLLYNNPSGKFFSSNWNKKDEKDKVKALSTFLRGELFDLQNDNKYSEFEGYKNKEDLIQRINDFLNTPNADNLSRLGFNQDYLAAPEVQGESPKSELEQEEEQLTQEVNDFTRKQKINETRKALAYAQDTNFSQNYGVLDLPEYSFLQDLNSHTPTWGNQSEFRKNYFQNTTKELSNYFAPLSSDWRNMLSYEGQLKTDFLYNLARLFSQNEDQSYPYIDIINKLFTKTNDGRYLLNNTKEENDRRVFYNPTEKRFEVRGYNSLQIPSQKQGGILEFQEGGSFDFETWDKKTNPSYYRNSATSTQASTKEEPNYQESSREWNGLDTAAVAADIGSIIASFVPGYGTASSLLLGAGSTTANFINDLNDKNVSLGDALWNGAKGLGADVIGLVPGLGTGAKGWKIATRLAKFGTGIMATLNTMDLAKNSPEIMNSFKKILSLKVNDMNLQDWRNVQNGLSMMATAGRLGHGIAVHKGYKGQLKPTIPKQEKQITTPKTKMEKAKAKIEEFKNKYKGEEQTYDYGGPNTLPWYHDANIYLWGANRSGLNLGLKNPYKVDMSTKLQQPPKPKKTRNRKPKEAKQTKNNLPTDRGLVWNEATHSYIKTKQLGGVLKSLRQGGIIKAQAGVSIPFLKGYASDEDWAYLNFGTRNNHNYADNGFSNREKGGIGWSRGLYNNGLENDLYQDLNSARQAQYNYYTVDEGKNIFGDVLKYYNKWKTSNPNGDYNAFINDYNNKVDTLRELNKGKLNAKFNDPGWEEFNNLFHEIYPSYGFTLVNENGKEVKKDDWSESLKDYFGESTARRVPSTFDDHNQFAELRNGLLNSGDAKSRVGIDNAGKLFIYDQSNDGVKEVSDPNKKENPEGVDQITHKILYPSLNLKNPFDPTLGLIAGQLGATVAANNYVYGNYKIPTPALIDPIHRQLAIVGDQEAVENARNQGSDLMLRTEMQRGSDQSNNVASLFDAHRIGRETMDNALYTRDAARQFETAQKLWELKNDDLLRNAGIHAQNSQQLRQYLKELEDLKMHHRHANAMAYTGAVSDVGNWVNKKYQRAQDITDRTNLLKLGDIDSYVEEQWKNDPVYRKYANKEKLSSEELKELQEAKLKSLKKYRQEYAEKYYNTFGNSWFGGDSEWTLTGKNGTKLEIEKLKQRGKDNDRYVKTFIALRKRNSSKKKYI